MTERRQRFLRLTALHERQHDDTVAVLRSTRYMLDTALRQAEAHEERARQALAEQHKALTDFDHESWLLSCAAFEIETLHAMHHRTQRTTLAAAVTVAEAAETGARRELRQTERLLESIRQDESAAASLKEQKMLDEATRGLNHRSSKQGNGLSALS